MKKTGGVRLFKGKRQTGRPNGERNAGYTRGCVLAEKFYGDAKELGRRGEEESVWKGGYGGGREGDN